MVLVGLGAWLGLVGIGKRWERGGRVVGVFGVPKRVDMVFESEVQLELGSAGILEAGGSNLGDLRTAPQLMAVA